MVAINEICLLYPVASSNGECGLRKLCNVRTNQHVLERTYALCKRASIHNKVTLDTSSLGLFHLLHRRHQHLSLLWRRRPPRPPGLHPKADPDHDQWRPDLSAQLLPKPVPNVRLLLWQIRVPEPGRTRRVRLLFPILICRDNGGRRGRG